MDEFERFLTEPHTIEELRDQQKALRAEVGQLNQERANLPLSDEARERWAAGVELDKRYAARIAEQEMREKQLIEWAGEPSRTEHGAPTIIRTSGSSGDDIYRVDDVAPGERGAMQLHDRAMKVVERATFPHTERADAQAQVQSLLDGDDERGSIAHRVITTGGPLYNRAFGKAIAGKPLTNEEARALSLAGSSGGFAVPFDLDPTIIPTSNGVVNPIREVARVVRTTADTWRGVSAGAITASYEAEATETTDNSPTLAQPEISTEKAQAFIPFSIEIGMDWPGLRAEMGQLLQDSKDALEAVKFLTGTGTNEPFGVLTGATNTVDAAGGADAFTLANLYTLQGALPPRYRPRAAFVGNLSILNRVRQFDTLGSSAMIWVDSLQEGVPSRLLGRPIYEASEMPGTAGTASKFMIYGDFSRYVIVDRVGLEVELIPHLFGANRRPTGQRGLYAFWRNGAKVVDANAFRALLGTA